MPPPAPSSQPTLADLQTFVTQVAGIPAAYLPPTSPALQYALNSALNITNYALARVPSQPGSWTYYEQAVLNLATHLIIVWAPDQSYTITAPITWMSGIATATTAAANLLQVGDAVVITGISPFFVDTPPGSQTIVYSVVNPTTFQYGLAANVPNQIPPNPGPVISIASNAAVTEQYFANQRKSAKITAFTAGVITSASDLTTSAGILNPAFMQGLTLMDLGLLQTFFGRTYLSLAQAYGPTIWGLS